ncbi:MAG: hypothetical protein F4Y61_06330, partial [Rhodothermaceae bacterium]|nr:hypothetical protein [Rhodothermaceae bacterium]
MLRLWLVSLLTGCAWAFPAIFPLVPNHQYAVYADVTNDDTATPDMYIHCNNALYEAIHRRTRPPFVASVHEIPLQHASESVEGGIIHESGIPVNPAGASANLSTTNEGVVSQAVQHHCAAAGVDRCIPGFLMPHNLAQGSGSSSQDTNAGTSGREEATLLVTPTTPKHINTIWGPSDDSSVSLNGDTTDSQVSMAVSSLGIGLPSQVAETDNAHLNDVEIVLDPNVDVFHMLEGSFFASEIDVKLSAQPVNDVRVTI